MAKFFVQSGSFRSIVEAESSRNAAIWAVHQAMQQILPMEDENPEWGDGEVPAFSEKPLAVLAGKLRVSQRGFDRADATQMATIEVVGEWNQLVTTLDRLEKMLYRAA